MRALCATVHAHIATIKMLIFVVGFTSSQALFATNFYQGLTKVGGGEMKWHFLKLYSADLYASSEKTATSFPLALSLTYKRNISSSALVKATAKEWTRMGLKETDRVAWLQRLGAIWPDVKGGDQLTYYADEMGNGRFIYNGVLIADSLTAKFSEQFLAIWLSEKARNQKLRKRLLGASYTSY